MLSEKVLVSLKPCSPVGRRSSEDGPSTSTVEVRLNQIFNLPDLLGVRGEEEAPVVRRVSFLASASRSWRGRVQDGGLRRKLFSPSEC